MKQTKIYKFFEQVKHEVNKIVWPEKKELFFSVVMVIIAVCVFSLIALFLDYSIHSVVKFILDIGK